MPAGSQHGFSKNYWLFFWLSAFQRCSECTRKDLPPLGVTCVTLKTRQDLITVLLLYLIKDQRQTIPETRRYLMRSLLLGALPMNFPAQLIQLRRQHGFTQQALADTLIRSSATKPAPRNQRWIRWSVWRKHCTSAWTCWCLKKTNVARPMNCACSSRPSATCPKMSAAL